MKTVNLKFQIPVSFLKEEEQYVTYSPVLDLSTSADSYEKAKKRFEEIVNIFFEEIIKKGTLEKVLTNLGWKKVKKQWNPPLRGFLFNFGDVILIKLLKIIAKVLNKIFRSKKRQKIFF